MKNQHLTYFKVENFKKFDSLEVKDIGQYNLIVGDNNVGKTCLLEALLYDPDNQKYINNLIQILIRRNLISKDTVKSLYEMNFKNFEILSNTYYNLLAKRFRKDSKKNNISFHINNNSVQNIGVERSSWDYNSIYYNSFISLIQSLRNINIEELNFPFISFNSIFENDIYQLYNNIKTKRDKENLINTIKVVDINIIDVELRQFFDDLESVFLLSFENKDEFIPVNYLGDGFKRIFYIILKVLSLKGERIMIDEIETGIHHSRQKEFWLNILKVCDELNVQLFATTHSDECIQAFYDASKELEEQKDIRLISLQAGEQEKIYSTTYTFENIEAGLYSNIELRA